jgi:hypothetical protein
MVVHPGSNISVGDVYDGLVPALRRRGHDIIEYPLSARIDRYVNWLKYNYRRAKKVDREMPAPTWSDALYLAAERVVPLALREQPNFILIVSGLFFHPDILILLRRAGQRIGLLCSESPYEDPQQFRILPAAQVVWTNERRSLDVLRLGHPNTHYLPHAYDPERHNPTIDVDEDVAAHDVCFVGTGFQERVDTLASVDWSGIDLGLYGNWDLLPPRHPLRRFVRGKEVPNTTTVSLYRRAKIGLNLYRTSMGYGRDAFRVRHADSLNPRALELAACGVFTLSDYRAEVEEVFGGAVPTFSTPGELERLIRHYLSPAGEAFRLSFAETLPGLVAGRTFDAMAEQIERDFVATTERLKERARAAA